VTGRGGHRRAAGHQGPAAGGQDDAGHPDLPADGKEAEFAEALVAGFRATSGGVTARFAAPQARIVRDLVGQIAVLVAGDPAAGQPDELAAELGLSDSTELPDDPVLARLLPDGYAEDPESAGEFRRYTEQGLRDGKVAAARTVLDTLPAKGGRVRLTEADARAWLRALNDVRLALGVRLGVTDDFDEQGNEIDSDDPRAAYVWVYHWLAYLQESLVDALS
jgi:Domain of unknown function (DUF2017)